MHRLVSAYGISVLKFYNTTISKSTMQQTKKVCSFCNFHHCKRLHPVSLQQFRSQSTATPNTISVSNKKPNVRRRSKKVTELLEVTDNQVTKKTKLVKKINAESLAKFVEESGEIRVGEGENSLTEQQLQILEHNISNETESDVVDFDNLPKTEQRAYSNEDFKQLSKLMDGESKQLDMINKKEEQGAHVKMIIRPYVYVAINNGEVDQAWQRIKRMVNSTKLEGFNDEETFCLLLNEYAQQMDSAKVKDILKYMKEEEVPITKKSLTAAFECLGALRSNHYVTDEELYNMIKFELESKNLTFDDLISQPFVRGQRENILNGLRIFDPNYEAPRSEEDWNYNTPLLEGIDRTKSRINPSEEMFTAPQLYDKFKKQIRDELLGRIQVRSIISPDEVNEPIQHARDEIAEIEAKWKKDIEAAFNREMMILKRTEDRKKHSILQLHQFFMSMQKEVFIDEIFNQVKSLTDLSENYSAQLASMYISIGSKIYGKYLNQRKILNGQFEKTAECYKKYIVWYLQDGDHSHNSRTAWESMEKELNEHGTSLHLDIPFWTPNILYALGKVMYKIIINDIKFKDPKTNTMIPAFYAVYRYENNRIQHQMKPHPTIKKLYLNSRPEYLDFEINAMPTLCPPVPWTSPVYGGYMLIKSPFIRLISGTELQYRRVDESPPGNLYPMFDSLNQLGSIPWCINKELLDIAIGLFKTGARNDLNIPRQFSSDEFPSPIQDEDGSISNAAKTKHKMAMAKAKNEMHSLWCDALYKLSLANHYRDEVFWLAYNLDFRGRVYPIPPHVTHLSADLYRSLLLFAKKKPLGENGLKWLKTHIINLTGFKKTESLKERLRYADEILPDIIDSAENPLGGKRWWTKSDEPWQTLSACMELNRALKSPNPTEYMSNLPIHQDGSCNGLQHYAALGRDIVGGLSVNLTPCEKPQDVYSNVAALVEARRAKDAENGLPVAIALKDCVSRKVIKQTVMTTVYGVTYYGARLQIKKKLEVMKDFTKAELNMGSKYLTVATFDSIRSMFTSAKDIQDWFVLCARFITCRGKLVEWITPLGLPVAQPYVIQPKKFSDNLDSVLKMDSVTRPNGMKQKNAFPPNYIHSLDSTHMMLTGLHCENKNVTYVSVHDCYWTHACTVNVMNNICREQFVALYSQPILEDLSEYFVKQFGFSPEELATDVNKSHFNDILKNVPKKGDLNLEEVLSSKYFFS